jgi:hypothetical protein
MWRALVYQIEHRWQRELVYFIQHPSLRVVLNSLLDLIHWHTPRRLYLRRLGCVDYGHDGDGMHLKSNVMGAQ